MNLHSLLVITLQLFLILGAKTLCAQDIHFSQFNRMPLFLNPALTGNFEGDIRAMAIYRNQWESVPVGYNSASISADYKIPFESIRDAVGIGIQLIGDRAGDGLYTTTQATFSTAYQWVRGIEKTLVLSVGANANFTQRSYDPLRLTFDQQFNGDYFDPSRPIGEQFDRTQLSFIDFGIGINANYSFADRHVISTGFSVAHINQTSQNFINSSTNTLLQPRYNAYLYANLGIKERISIVPMLYTQHQDTRYENVIGTGLKLNLTTLEDSRMNLTLGTSYRLQDAWIPWAFLEYQNWSAKLSYDFNTSPLRIASQSYGGIELSLGMLISYRERSTASRLNFCPYIWY